MMNFNERWLTIAGCGLLCAALAAMIGARFMPQIPADEPIQSSVEETPEVNPMPELPEIQEEEIAVVIPEPQPEETGEAVAHAVSSGTEQTIQPDPVIPPEPEKPVAQGDHTNPDQQPTYKPEDTVKPSQPSAPKTATPTAARFMWTVSDGSKIMAAAHK